MNNTNRRIEPRRNPPFADPRRRPAGLDAQQRLPSRALLRQTAEREGDAPHDGGSTLTTGLLPAAMGLLIWLAAILIVLGESIP